MGVAAGDVVLLDHFVFVVIDQMDVPRDKSRRDSTRANCCDHEDGDVATAATLQSKRLHGILNSLFVA